MRTLTQTRLMDIDQEKGTMVRGNPLATIIACFLDLSTPEEAIQVQDFYDKGEATWTILLSFWLEERGWDWGVIPDHLYNDEFYIVYGTSPRGTTHACIYQNGFLYHDPHPSGEGLVSEDHFEFIRPTKMLN